MRDAFEHWVDSQLVDANGFASRHRLGDEYCQNEINSQWKAWTAACAVASKKD